MQNNDPNRDIGGGSSRTASSKKRLEAKNKLARDCSHEEAQLLYCMYAESKVKYRTIHNTGTPDNLPTKRFFLEKG